MVGHLNSFLAVIQMPRVLPRGDVEALIWLVHYSSTFLQHFTWYLSLDVRGWFCSFLVWANIELSHGTGTVPLRKIGFGKHLQMRTRRLRTSSWNWPIKYHLQSTLALWTPHYYRHLLFWTKFRSPCIEVWLKMTPSITDCCSSRHKTTSRRCPLKWELTVYKNKFSLKNKTCFHIKRKRIPEKESFSRKLRKFMFTCSHHW